MLAQGTMLRNNTYRVESPLASGGFGNTYKVRNVAFDEVYALKEFFMKGINLRTGNVVTVSVPDNHNSYESQKEKFRKEAQRLRRLENPHIVKVHDMFDENGTSYYVMDYIDGLSLSAILKQKPNGMSEDEVRAILPQVLDALKTVHEQKIWHLDIKPGNIMVDSKGHAYLIDFGASKQLRSDGGQTSSALCYTPGFAPMEQVEQDFDKFGPWTDFYALGATIYNLLTKKQPPSSAEILEGNPFQFPAGVSKQMQDLVKWMMMPQRTKRPQSVAEILARLNMAPNPGPTPPPPLPTAPPKSAGSAWKVIVPVLIALLLGGAAAWYFLFNKGGKSAAEKDEEYMELVEKCEKAINAAADFDALSDAATLLSKVEKVEEENDSADGYDASDDLKDKFAQKKKKLKDECLEEADAAIDRNDYHEAYNVVKAAADALPDDSDLERQLQSLASDMGNIYVNYVTISNGKDNPNDISSMKSDDIRYLWPVMNYSSLQESGASSASIELMCDFVKPDGTVDRSDNSPSHHTYRTSLTLEPGEAKEETLLGWGNENQSNFTSGEYRFDIYYQGNRIYTMPFIVK